MTTPGPENEPTHPSPESEYVDPLADVFGSPPPSPNLTAQHDGANAAAARARPADDPSDVPRLRSIHVTNGYREGIAASKEQHIQEGFDEGYSLGAEVALKAGFLLGVLEGVYHALVAQSSGTSASSAATADGGISELAKIKEEVEKMLEEAEEELKVEKLFSKDYFGEDGIWLYDVPGREDEGEVTFARVAEGHPVVKSWSERLRGVCESVSLDLG